MIAITWTGGGIVIILIFERIAPRPRYAALTSMNMTTIGFVVSFIVAYVVVKTFIAFVSRFGLKPFGWYRVLTGVALIALMIIGL